MTKYSNHLILLILLSIGFLFKDYIHVSTNLLSLFASKDSIEKLSIAGKLGYSKELLIVVKGFDKESQKKVLEISDKIKKIPNINFVQSDIMPSKEIQNYYKKYYPLLTEFSNQQQSTEQVKEKLKTIYDKQMNSLFYTSVDKNDPLDLFTLQKNNTLEVAHRGKLIALGNYGYLIRASTNISASQMNAAKILYKDIHAVLDSYPDVVSFAPFYYTVENSTKIQEDVRWILILSTLVLLIIYYILIKNMRLLGNTLVALFSSMVFAGLVSSLVFTNFNVLSLAFGMSITAVSIDYLLHYHFHNFYQNKKTIDKNVLYGYVTTMLAFGIFSFIPIPMISQISFFAVMSLSFAFVLFTFIFPKLSIEPYTQKENTNPIKKTIPANIFFLASLLFFLYSSFAITLDDNIRNLDYQNHKLRNVEALLKKNNQADMTPVIVQASSNKELIDNLHKLHKSTPNTFSLASFVPNQETCLKRRTTLNNYDFDTLTRTINKEANSIGFKDGYFSESYQFIKKIPSCEINNFEIFKTYNLSTFEDKNTFYTIALVNNTKRIDDLNFASTINVKEMFSKLANQMYKDLLLYSLLVVCVILVLLFISVKRKLLYALNYILFPTSLTLAVLVSFTEINLMHIFSFIILIAIGIDYGIYMSNTKKPSNTVLAIKYSILSTFGAFGVLIFSSIIALNSIGLVITIGTATIFLLTKVMR